MSDLANNIQGEHFSLPATAAYWRVRRLKEGRGAPEVVFGPDGGPLLVAVEIDFEAFRAAVEYLPGRYRLDALDETRRPIEGIPAAYVAVPAPARTARAQAEPVVEVSAAPAVRASVPGQAGPLAVGPHDALLAEVIRGQNQLVALMTERFSGFMVSAADLVRAIPHHVLTSMTAPPLSPAPAPPAAPPPSDPVGPRNAGSYDPAELEPDAWDGDVPAGEEAAPPSGVAAAMTVVNNIVGEVMPVVKLFMTHRMTKAGRSPRNTAPPVPEPAAPPVAPIAAPEPASGPLSLAELRHLDAIDAALTPGEARRHQLVADDLPPRDRRDWFDALCSLDVEDAVARIRRHIARAQRMHGGPPSTHPTEHAPSPPAGDDPHPLQEDTDDPAPETTRDPDADLTDTPDELPNEETRHSHDDDAGDAPCDCPEVPCPSCGEPPTACGCAETTPPIITPEMIAHAMAVQAALTPTESARVLALAAEMLDDERDGWMAELSRFTVADAVQAVREALAGIGNGSLRRGEKPEPTASFVDAPRPAPSASSPTATPSTSRSHAALAAPETHDR
jgi:hypothetical protein